MAVRGFLGRNPKIKIEFVMGQNQTFLPLSFLIFNPRYAFSMARSEHHTNEAWPLDRLRRLVAQSLKGRLSVAAIITGNVEKMF